MTWTTVWCVLLAVWWTACCPGECTLRLVSPHNNSVFTAPLDRNLRISLSVAGRSPPSAAWLYQHHMEHGDDHMVWSNEYQVTFQNVGGAGDGQYQVTLEMLGWLYAQTWYILYLNHTEGSQLEVHFGVNGIAECPLQLISNINNSVLAAPARQNLRVPVIITGSPAPSLVQLFRRDTVHDDFHIVSNYEFDVSWETHGHPKDGQFKLSLDFLGWHHGSSWYRLDVMNAKDSQLELHFGVTGAEELTEPHAPDSTKTRHGVFLMMCLFALTVAVLYTVFMWLLDRTLQSQAHVKDRKNVRDCSCWSEQELKKTLAPVHTTILAPLEKSTLAPVPTSVPPHHTSLAFVPTTALLHKATFAPVPRDTNASVVHDTAITSTSTSDLALADEPMIDLASPPQYNNTAVSNRRDIQSAFTRL